MSSAHEFLHIIEEQKTNLPDALYLELTSKLHDMFNDESEMLIVAVIAQSLAQGYFEDDEIHVAQKVSQRVLHVKCTPVSEKERKLFIGKGPSFLLQRGKYRDIWFKDYANNPLHNDMYPLVLEHITNEESVVIVTASQIHTIKKRRKVCE